MSSRKNLIAQIQMTEQKLYHHQSEVIKHQDYLLNAYEENKVVLWAIIAPFIILVFVKGRNSLIFGPIRKLLKLGFVMGQRFIWQSLKVSLL